MTRTETFQKVLALYEAFRKQNNITGYYSTEPYWQHQSPEGWMMSERMTEMTSKGNCEQVTCTNLIHDLNDIHGVAAKEAYAPDGTYGFSYVIMQ